MSSRSSAELVTSIASGSALPSNEAPGSVIRNAGSKAAATPDPPFVLPSRVRTRSGRWRPIVRARVVDRRERELDAVGGQRPSVPTLIADSAAGIGERRCHRHLVGGRLDRVAIQRRRPRLIGRHPELVPGRDHDEPHPRAVGAGAGEGIAIGHPRRSKGFGKRCRCSGRRRRRRRRGYRRSEATIIRLQEEHPAADDDDEGRHDRGDDGQASHVEGPPDGPAGRPHLRCRLGGLEDGGDHAIGSLVGGKLEPGSASRSKSRSVVMPSALRERPRARRPRRPHAGPGSHSGVATGCAGRDAERVGDRRAAGPCGGAGPRRRAARRQPTERPIERYRGR